MREQVQSSSTDRRDHHQSIQSLEVNSWLACQCTDVVVEDGHYTVAEEEDNVRQEMRMVVSNDLAV